MRKQHDAELCERIRQLEERVRELEARPHGWYGGWWQPPQYYPYIVWNDASGTNDTTITSTSLDS